MGKGCCADCVYGVRPKGAWWGKIMASWPGVLICFQSDRGAGSLALVAGEWKCGNFHSCWVVEGRGELPEPPSADIRYISLTKGKYAIVDAEDYERLAKHRWFAKKSGSNKFYACRTENGRGISMHREIMQPAPGKVVDHIDGNGIYNRRRNMRNCTISQNAHNTNRPVKEGKVSKYIGVFRRDGKWGARLAYNGKQQHIGMFDTEIEAAMARDRKAIEVVGEYAKLNFPREILEARWPELRAYRRNPSSGPTSAP
jgi:hypothetical protein